MKQNSIIRIWLRYKEDGVWHGIPQDIATPSFREAEKIIDYLNSKNTDKTREYYYKHELLKTYKTAEEYIKEQENYGSYAKLVLTQ